MRREQEKQLPVPAINARLISGRRLENCWHPEASKETCGKKIVQAHSLQRSSVLRGIVDDTNHVLTFCPPRHDHYGNPVPTEMGWKEASTFKGFCDSHDRELFAPIETRPFEATNQQCFLLAYRAACHELHQKMAMWEHAPSLQGMMDRGSAPADQQAIQANYRQMLGATGWALIRQQRFKAQMDESLRSEHFGDWQFAVLNFSGPLEVVSTGVVEPNVDFAGAVIQEDILQESQSVAYATVLRDGGVSVALAWRKDHAAPLQFWRSLLTYSSNELPQVLTQFMFAYVENTFFSRRWWEKRRMFIKEHITHLALTRHPYMDRPSFVPKHVVSLVLESAQLL